MVDRLNTPGGDRATGITAPLVRAASHIGYILGYVDEMGDRYAAEREQLAPDMSRELEEAIRHLRDSLVTEDNAFVSQDIVTMLSDLRLSIDGLRASVPEERGDLIRDLQNLNHNIAFIGARLDRDTAGLSDAHEGLVT